MTYAKQVQKIITEYREAGERWPATKREIGGWAIATGRWQMPPAAVLGSGLNQIQNATMVARATADRKLAASLS